MLTQCSKESLNKSYNVFKNSQSSLDAGRPRSRDWSERCQLVSDAHYVHSLLAAAEGLHSEALLYARLSVKNCQRAWAILERSLSRKDRTVRNGITDGEKDSIVEAMSEVSISERPPAENTPAPHSALQAAAFWTLVPRLFRGLTHIALLFANHGLTQEVRYYLEQGQKVAEGVRAPSLIGQCCVLLGQHSVRSGTIDDGSLLLQQAETVLSGVPHDRHFAMLQLFLAKHHTDRGDHQAGEAASATAEKTVQHLMKKRFLDRLIHKLPVVEALDLQMSGLSLEEPETTTQPPKNQGRTVARKPRVKSAGQQKPPMPASEEIPGFEVIALNRIKSEIIRSRINRSTCAGRLEDAASLLEEVAANSCGQQDVIAQALVASQVHLCQGLERLISDPVYCVIPESAISCPSIRAFSERRRPSTAKLPEARTTTTTAREQRNKGVFKKARGRGPSPARAKVDFLRLAQEDLSNVLSMARKYSSTVTLNQMTDVLARILIMLSATSSLALNSQVSPTRLVYALGKLLQSKA